MTVTEALAWTADRVLAMPRPAHPGIEVAEAALKTALAAHREQPTSQSTTALADALVAYHEAVGAAWAEPRQCVET